MNDCVATITDLRKLIKGIPGNKDVKIKALITEGRYMVTDIKRIVWNDNWKSYMIETN